MMNEYIISGEQAHLCSVQQLLHAFSDSPSSLVLLTTALGEMLGILARQQRSIDEIVSTLQITREDRMQEISAVSNNFAEILHDTIKRTALAINEIREHFKKYQEEIFENNSSLSDINNIGYKKEISELRKLVLERLQNSSSLSYIDDNNNNEILSKVSAIKSELRESVTQQQILLELFDVKKTLIRHGYTGDSTVDLLRLRSLDTLAKVRLAHHLPCFHVLTSAISSPERRMINASSLSPF